MATFPKLKKRDMNDMVSIEMPAHMWLSFLAAYLVTDWATGPANTLAELVQEELLDPLYVREKQAEMQFLADQHQAQLHSFFTGQPPEPPPTEGYRD